MQTGESTTHSQKRSFKDFGIGREKVILKCGDVCLESNLQLWAERRQRIVLCYLERIPWVGKSGVEMARPDFESSWRSKKLVLENNDIYVTLFFKKRCTFTPIT